MGLKMHLLFKFLLLSIALAGFSGCASMGFTDDQNKLIETIAFDQHCPKEKIQIMDRLEGGVGITKYNTLVCGKNMKYLRMGTSYFEDGKQPYPTK